ncbi:M13 family metallopeptidase [Lysobacter sp. A6]|uniref:M13 family metallopeptidase n=1 Tax=Noviluteimonas lactosilytica TaxID=2888523 RepID=A0ABS8JJ63_9GAMM|nr:M13 family metallopeptidase [Lysobacter lactosilyticus]
MIRPSLPLVALLAVATVSAGELHGIQPGDINRNADACTDFFDYANGAWRQQNPIPDYMDRWSRRWESGEVNKEHVRDILTELSAKTDWPQGSAGQLAGDFYAACMDESRVDALGSKPVQPWLADVDAIQDTAGLQREIGKLHAVGVTVPFGVYASEDLHEPSKTIAHVYASGLGMPDRDYYLKTEPRFVEARAKYLVHVAKMFELAGLAPEQAKQDADTVFAFEKRLAEASFDNVQLRDPQLQDHPTAFADLAKLAPAFDWAAYFDAANMPHDAVNVMQPKFVQQVDKELATTPLAQWKPYLRWQILHAAADSLSRPFVEENFAFNGKFLAGTTQIKPRWKRCAEATDNQLGEALGQKYVEKYFPPEAKSRMQEMVKNILLAMDDTIRELDWMDEATKKKALEKRATFFPKLGYPDKFKDYKGVVVSRDSAWDNVVAASRWNVADNRSQVGKPTDRSRWGMTPPTSNAYYNPLQNEIVFPAGILQPPAFDVTATDAVNYGAIGVVIGHEISHGFDDQGAQFDAQGRLANWWTPEDNKQFQAKGQCVVDQFEGYEIEPGVHHNGKLVLGESIGDLAGAKIAYRAYLKSREGKGPEPTLDGFTPEQQFFIAWGQFRGDETRMETQRTMIQGDPHPVAKYRVNGPVSNLPAFREAFQCKADAPMVRAEKDRCEVW